MDVPTRPDDALVQPTRARLFSVLSELRRPAGTEELADRLALNRNGVRVHLERLLEAGLVSRERRSQGRGRPRDMWSIAADARPGGDPPTGYADLGRWLARALSPGEAALRKVEEAGREIGRDLAPQGTLSAEEKMQATLVSLGFQPEREVDPAGRLSYRLCNCPYRDAVRESQEVVCTLHRGITRGLLDAVAPKTKLTRFVPRDPYTAGCLIELRGQLADEAAASNPTLAEPD
jgi:predicted ArsR family transcriptional regulator